ncbi:SNF2 family N-terminal domain-containing protein [Syncephalis plumigaleata]|nr:SNF2 family N-terminal domain-containing protein [Syncephalis plumigaleata]
MTVPDIPVERSSATVVSVQILKQTSFEDTTALSMDETTYNKNDQAEDLTPTTMSSEDSTNDTDETTAVVDGVVTEAMLKEETALRDASKKDHLKRLRQQAVEQYAELTNHQQRHNRLHFLLEKSAIYANFLAEKLERQQKQAKEVAERKEQAAVTKSDNNSNATDTSTTTAPLRRSDRSAHTANTPVDDAPAPAKRKRGRPPKHTATTTSATATTGRKRTDDTQADYNLADYVNAEDLAKRRKTSDTLSNEEEATEGVAEHLGVATLQPSRSTRQPALISGGILKEYQLAGMEWLVSLYENGLNGILADEMGLGKTVQCISFIAYLRERSVWGPYLIAAPLSTLANWVCEFKRFAPLIPVILYHGTPDERQHLRNKKMRKLDPNTFPVIVTSYEMVMNDRKYLEKYEWKYIVVDEGHRIKNLNCKLIRELKACRSANRLLLTGTPLQNNLAELWSLLNFLLPDIFDDLDSFQSWFDFSDLNDKTGQERIIGEEAESRIVSKLHQILKPFLLRRLKSDVEHMLPKKREYLLYAPLSPEQKELYDAIINRKIREYLIQQKLNGLPNNKTKALSNVDENTTKKTITEEEEQDLQRKSDRLTHQDRLDYDETISDDVYLQRLESSMEQAEQEDKNELRRQQKEEAEKRNNAVKAVNRLHLQARLVQVLKACNHPQLFTEESLPHPLPPAMAKSIVSASGKMRLLDQLLPALFARGHRVLIFSQMTRMLDIIEIWITEVKKWNTFRIDGGVKQEERRRMIAEFNGDKSMKYPVFLLSTRAGGLGINLTAADTVILFDSDWNPQMDLQAQDRVHRIGQTRPVIIYRLVTSNTLESRVLECATAKRKLEKLVIHRGRFRDAMDRSTVSAPLGMKELAEILLENELESVNRHDPTSEDTVYASNTSTSKKTTNNSNLLSASDMDKLMDRSEEAYQRAADAKQALSTGVAASATTATTTSGAFSLVSNSPHDLLLQE